MIRRAWPRLRLVVDNTGPAPGLLACAPSEVERRDDCQRMTACLRIVLRDEPDALAARCPRDCSRYAPTASWQRAALAVDGRCESALATASARIPGPPDKGDCAAILRALRSRP